MSSKKKITDFDCCPHCQSDFGYYVEARYKGAYNDAHLFETREVFNPEMFDGAKDTWRSVFYRCFECYKIICRTYE